MNLDIEKNYSPDRRGTNSFKWDAVDEKFGSDNLLPLWVADMDFKVPDCVNEAIHKMADFGVYGYYVTSENYYDAVISWEKRKHGYEIKKEWLRYTIGVVPALYWFINILTQPGDSCIINAPCYYPFMEAIKDTGRNLVCCDLINNNGYYTIDFNKFEEEVCENNIKLFLLCSPHNPVGRVWTHDELKKTLDICKKHKVFVISDEIHQDIVMNGYKNIPSATIGDYDEILVTVTAASKTFNLAGLKNSFAIIPNEEIREKFDKYIKTIQVFKGTIFGYVAVEAAYNYGEPWLKEVLEIIEGNFMFLRDTLISELPKIVVTPLEATYLMWIDIGAYVSHEGLQDFVQEKCKLAVDYGDWFFEKGKDTHIRVNLATSRKNIEIAAKNLINEIKILESNSNKNRREHYNETNEK